MCIQRRYKSVCASAQSDLSLNFLPEEMLDPWLPIEGPLKTDQTVQMPRLIWVFDGHTYQLVPFCWTPLDIRSLLSPTYTFACWIILQDFHSSTNLYACFFQVNLSGILSKVKQLGSRSSLTFSLAWSGFTVCKGYQQSTKFATSRWP